MTTAPQFYTAAQLATALGVTARAVQLRLKGTPHTGEKKSRGQTTKAWSFAALPVSLRDELSALVKARGYTGIEHLIEQPRPFTAEIPWHQISKPHQDRALTLCSALAPALARQHSLAGPDLMELAAGQYRQHFGHEITADKLRYLMDRATRRDNGFNQWERPDLYLDDAAFRKTVETPQAAKDLHSPLNETLTAIQDKANPSDLDTRTLFPAAFLHFEALVVVNPSKGEQRSAKRALVEFLFQHVPGLYSPNNAANAEAESKPLLALRTLFNRKLAEWIELGRPSILPPDRRVNCGRKLYKHDPCDKLIKAHAARLRGERGAKGNLDLAITILSEKKAICAECVLRRHPRRLSAAARVYLTPNALQVASMKDAHAIKKIAPTHHCDRSDRNAGDRFVIDDMTPNELTWDEVDGEIVSGQAQMLATEDEISRYPLPFLLYIGAPNSHTITKEIALVLTHVGLPHEALLTERGVFANRRTAGQRGIQHQTDFRELQAMLENHFQFAAAPDEVLTQIRRNDLGLRDPAFRLGITQARNPQGKSIEGSFNTFQKSASRLPGFAGFNQRNEQSRTMQDFARRVSIGKEHPGNEYLHLAELRKNYELIFTEIANRPVNGQVHRGRTPLEAWKEALSRRPLRKLPEEIEALLATQRLPSIKVHPQGICISLNRFDKAFYFNEFTGPLVGRQVAVRINYDIPEYIHVEHPETGSLMKVPRAFTKSRTATPEQIAEVRRARRAHINGALGEIGNVENIFTAHVIRDSMHSPGDKAAGTQIAADAVEHKAEQRRESRERKVLEQKAAILGTSIHSQPRNMKRINEGLELEEEALRAIAALEQSGDKNQ